MRIEKYSDAIFADFDEVETHEYRRRFCAGLPYNGVGGTGCVQFRLNGELVGWSVAGEGKRGKPGENLAWDSFCEWVWEEFASKVA